MDDPREQAGAERLDVGAVLEELRAGVRARRQALGHDTEGPLDRELRRSLDEIELYRVVSAHWPLLGRTVPQRAITLVNKLVRRYLRWYINPIVEQQNAYNDAVARTLRLLAEAYGDIARQLAETQVHTPPPDGTIGDDQPAGHDPAPRPDPPAAGAGYAELVAAVHERAAAEPQARFPDLELRALEPQLRLRQEVNAHWPLGGQTPAQRATALVNKLVRRYLRWYVNPIVEQQNDANAAFTAALLNLIRLDAERRAQVAGIRAETRRHGDTETR